MAFFIETYRVIVDLKKSSLTSDQAKSEIQAVLGLDDADMLAGKGVAAESQPGHYSFYVNGLGIEKVRQKKSSAVVDIVNQMSGGRPHGLKARDISPKKNGPKF